MEGMIFRSMALVYQWGIANVFGTDAGQRLRLVQCDYSSAEWFARGAMHAGAEVAVYHCDLSGDLAHAQWEQGKGDLFAGSKRPPIGAKYAD